MSRSPAASCAGLSVLYDFACPLCRREIGVHRNLSPLQPVQYLDVSRPDTPLPTGGRDRGGNTRDLASGVRMIQIKERVRSDRENVFSRPTLPGARP